MKPKHCLFLPALLLLTGPTIVHASPELARKHGCSGCHAEQTKLVGPALRDVADKYRDDADAVAKIEQQIRAGGSGRWGEVPMPPQAQVPAADVRKLARWILTLRSKG